MTCFDQEVRLSGNAGNSHDLNYLRILFEQCDQAQYPKHDVVCKTNSEVNQWIKDKHIVTLQRQESFNEAEYETPINRFSEIRRYQLFRSLKVEYPINVQIQHVKRSDSLFSVGLLFQEDGDIYTTQER